MTIEEFQALLREWCQVDGQDRETFLEIKANVEFLEKVLYETYEPVLAGGHGNFRKRLAEWIGSATTENDQKNLFLILKHLFYLGPEDIKAAYLTAYSKNIMSWLLTKGGISPFEANAERQLQNLLRITAYTEITDSFSLGNFMRINNIQGVRRYTWHQNTNNWRANEFKANILDNGTKKFLILLEDFVGSGSQMEGSIRLACSPELDVEVLLCPLIICPLGAEFARTLQDEYPRLTYSPVLEIPTDHFIHQNPRAEEHQNYPRIRTTLENLHPKVSGTVGSWSQDYGPFGFGEMGGIFAKYDNCPDNTIPALHHRSDLGWEPLFFRSSREL